MQWIKICIASVRIKRGDRERGRLGKFISFPCDLIIRSFLFKSFHNKCLQIYLIILISTIIQLIVHSCAFLIFTHFSVYVLYNVPLDTKMAAFRSSHFSLAYTGRRDSTWFPPLWCSTPWKKQTCDYYGLWEIFSKLLVFANRNLVSFRGNNSVLTPRLNHHIWNELCSAL